MGIAFTPMWSGVLAATNAYHLGLNMLWRPVVVGVLAVLLCLLLPWILSIIVYAGALILIWRFDLQPQFATIASQASSSNRDLLIPCLAGAPLALFAFVGLLVLPFADSSEPTSMDRYIESTRSLNQPAPAARTQQISDPSEIFARIKQRDEDKKNTMYKTWAAAGLAKLFSGTVGKALGLLVVGLIVGLFKWFTRKPTTNKGAV